MAERSSCRESVFTNEPGIYVRLDALDQMPFGWTQEDWEKFKTAVRPAFEKYKGIGVQDRRRHAGHGGWRALDERSAAAKDQ